MQADFLDAHYRHWKDAEILFAQARLANADHLYGIAAECGLKKLMQIFGMPIDLHNGSPLNSKDKKHINQLRAQYITYLSGSYSTYYSLSSIDPFKNWDVANRYSADVFFDNSYVEPHKIGASDINELILKAKSRGDI